MTFYQSFKLKGAVAVVAMLSLLFAGLSTVQAQETTGGVGLAVSPPNTDITVAPGETITRSVEVTNNGSSEAYIEMSANNFTAAGEDGGAAYSAPGTGGLADWLTLSPASFTLAGGESTTVSYTVEVPDSASAGGHYATLFAQSAAQGDVDGSGAAIGSIVGANLLVNVSGNIIESAAIAEFSTPRSRLNAGEETEFTVRFTNSGTSHVQPQGVIELFRKGVKVDEINVNVDGSSVLPNSTRAFTVTSDATLLPGAYTASLTMTYGTSGEVLTAPDLSFAVIGDSSILTIVAAGLAVLVVLLALALIAGRKRGSVK